MIVIENFIPITKLDADATQADIIAKVNEIVDAVNEVIPSHNGDDGLVDE